MKCKTIISFGFLFISLVACAQSRKGIVKADAFFSEHFPGNIPVDAEGKSINNGPDTINTIYLETRHVSTKWTAAWKNGKKYSVITTDIKETPVQVGINKLSNQRIILKPATGNKLWLLRFEKGEILSKPPVTAKTGEIILQGKSGKKIIIQRISSQAQLAVTPSV